MNIWWHWGLLGLALLIIEVLVPGGFYLIFFGVGALIVGIMVQAGLQTLWMQWLLFSILSIASLVLFRGPLLRKIQAGSGTTHAVDSFLGEIAIALDDIPPDSAGKAELRGAPWNAHNNSKIPLAKGQRCCVDKVEGLTLWIKAE